MKKLLAVVMSVVIAAAVMCPVLTASAAGDTDYTIVNPYETVDWDSWQYYKANLHTHSVASDGDETITDMVGLYYDAGYDILALTDHGVVSHGWNLPRKTNGVFNCFRKADPMSDEDYQRITTGSDRGGRGMTDITGGIEINMAVFSKTHVNGYFTEYGQGEWGIENDYRTAPAKVEEMGGYSVLNHVGDWVNSNRYPERSHWDVFITYFANIFKDYHTCLGMEIKNNTDNVTRADRALWDELLQVVIPTGRNIWAFADDDSEYRNEVGRSFEYFVLPENTEEAVKTGMINGTFFACSRYEKHIQAGVDDFEGNGNVPLVKNIIVDQQANTIELVLDESRDCSLIEWVADGKVISNDLKIDLNDFESKLGCYVRFKLQGEGGVTYSQPFELKYENRVDKDIPTRYWFFDTFAGELFLSIYRTRAVTIMLFLIEKIGCKIFGSRF